MLGSSTRADAASTLVARWKMDETSGTAMRDSVAGHDGSLHADRIGVVGPTRVGQATHCAQGREPRCRRA